MGMKAANGRAAVAISLRSLSAAEKNGGDKEAVADSIPSGR